MINVMMKLNLLQNFVKMVLSKQLMEQVQLNLFVLLVLIILNHVLQLKDMQLHAKLDIKQIKDNVGHVQLAVLLV